MGHFVIDYDRRTILTAILIFASTVLVNAQQQVDLGPSKDNTLYESGTGALSNGAGVFMFAGENNNGEIRRGLVRFDVSAIPAGAVIQSAAVTLTLSKSAGGDATVSLHRVSADWGEGTSDASAEEGGGAAATTGDATWIHRFSATSTWTSAGGDFAASASASRTVGSTLAAYAWTSTNELVADVQLWVDTPGNNFGWLVKGAEGGTKTSKRFDTRETETSTNAPKLSVTYTVPTAVDQVGTLPSSFTLHANHPNPFNPSTRIRFDIPQASAVSIVLYDLFGRNIRTIAEGDYGAGSHEVGFEATGLAAGVYYYRMTAGEWSGTRKMNLIK